jgi:CheY-like chemotaxis protein
MRARKTRRGAGKRGWDDYLTKPITAVTLGKALARWAPPEGEGARLKPRAG